MIDNHKEIGKIKYAHARIDRGSTSMLTLTIEMPTEHVDRFKAGDVFMLETTNTWDGIEGEIRLVTEKEANDIHWNKR